MTYAEDFWQSMKRSAERERQALGIRAAKYWIVGCGICSDTVGDVIIDRKIALIQWHPHNELFLCPLIPNAQPSQAEAWFYCDCMAYEHDIPTIVYPTATELSAFHHRYAHNGPSKPRTHLVEDFSDEGNDRTYVANPIPGRALTRAFLVEDLLTILDLTRETRHGPMTFVPFRTHRYRRRVYLDYSDMYRSVNRELGLYSAALRQPDFLAEYLSYYRVVESTTGSNGKKWIATALGRLGSHRFGRILIGHSEDLECKPQSILGQYKPRNVLGVYKRRAAVKLRQLRKAHGSDERVAWYLYNINRCGIAHGVGQVVRGDVTSSYFEIGRDAVLLKMLARMAIDEKRTQ